MGPGVSDQSGAAAAFLWGGGGKSKMRSHCSMFALGTAGNSRGLDNGKRGRSGSQSMHVSSSRTPHCKLGVRRDCPRLRCGRPGWTWQRTSRPVVRSSAGGGGGGATPWPVPPAGGDDQPPRQGHGRLLAVRGMRWRSPPGPAAAAGPRPPAVPRASPMTCAGGAAVRGGRPGACGAAARAQRPAGHLHGPGLHSHAGRWPLSRPPSGAPGHAIRPPPPPQHPPDRAAACRP